MVRFERALQIGFGLWLLDSAFAFSTLQTQTSRGARSRFSSTARSIRRPSGLVVSSKTPQQGLLKDDEPKFEQSNLFGQETVDSVIGDAGSIGQDVILVNLDSTAPSSDVASGLDQETLVVLSKDLEEKTEVSIPSDIPQTIFTYTQANGTDVSDLAEKSIAITENVGAILAASEDAMIAAEATLSAEVKKELGSFSNGTDSTVSTFVEDLVDIIPAEDVVGEAVTKSNFDAPPVMKILKFAIPAVGVWLCSPLLSLIDTSAVGMLSGTVHQAALNPAVAVTDYAALLIVSLRECYQIRLALVFSPLTPISLSIVLLHYPPRRSCTPRQRILLPLRKNLIEHCRESPRRPFLWLVQCSCPPTLDLHLAPHCLFLRDLF